MKRYMSYVVSFFITISLFIQGIYFYEQVTGALIVTCGLLFVVVSVNKTLKIPTFKTGVGFYYFVYYFFAHIVGYITFLEKGMLVYEVLRSLWFVMVYLLVYQVYDKHFKQSFKWLLSLTIFVAGLMATGAYLLNLWPTLHYVMKERLSGPLQYSNTWAIVAIIGLMFFIDLGLPTVSKSLIVLRILGMIGFIVPFILSMSRGGIAVGIVMMVLYCIFMKLSKETFWQLITSIIISGIIVYLLDQGGALDRIGSTTLQASSFQTRLLYYDDSVEMIRARLRGYGPYGYKYLQRAFQTGSTYYVKYVHSSIIQMALDLGIVTALVTLVYGCYAMVVQKNSWLNRLAIMTIIGHSLVDVDMSYGYLWIILIVLVQGVDGWTVDMMKGQRLLPFFSMMVLVAMLSLYFMNVTLLFDLRAYEAVDQMYPYHTENIRYHLTNMEEGEEKVILANRLLSYNNQIIEGHEALYTFNKEEGNYEEALYHCREMVRLNRLNITRYEQLSDILRKTGQDYLAKGMDQEARKYFKEITEMPAGLEQLAKEMITDYNVNHKPYLGMTPKLYTDVQVAEEWLKQIKVD